MSLKTISKSSSKPATEPSKVQCPCGSNITNKKAYLRRHYTSKRHIRFVETGIPAPKDYKEYQRRRFNNNPEKREKQRQACRAFYRKNIGKQRLRSREYYKSSIIEKQITA
jgi:hypothetical protein